jgi:glycosyltransferase involved in cell wall biosynthesis
MMKIVLWHGYLLGGTGSNVYTRSLARVWSRLGHEVVVVCQEPHPERYDIGTAVVVRPDIGPLLPVFVLDRYEHAVPRLLQDLTEAERAEYVERNAAAVRAVAGADVVFANHVLLGGPVGAASGLPFAVKAHGSELEFSMRGRPDLGEWARRSLDAARLVVAGSDHISGVLDEVVGASDYTKCVQVIPPGVDVDDLAPQPRDQALGALVAECARDAAVPPGAQTERHPDRHNAQRLGDFLAGDQRTVVYVGKLSEEKGVALLIAALEQVDARAVVVGFGPARTDLEAEASDRVLFTGALEHRHLRHLWALADVSVTPSVFPEAFGMVAAEAAACGSPPLVARHSGLAEIAAGLEAEYPPAYRHLAAFETGNAGDLAARLGELLALPREEWLLISRAARAAAVRHWSWERVAAELLAGMEP